jgi:hypothetical protein
MLEGPRSLANQDTIELWTVTRLWITTHRPRTMYLNLTFRT